MIGAGDRGAESSLANAQFGRPSLGAWTLYGLGTERTYRYAGREMRLTDVKGR